MLGVGGKFILNNDALQNYGKKYGGKTFTVTHVATSKEEHPGYDEAMDGMALYDAEGLDFSVYEWEVLEV